MSATTPANKHPSAQPDKKHKPSKRTIIIASSIAAILVAGGATAWAVSAHANSQLTQAQETCAQASDQQRVAANQYDTYLKGDAATAYKITDKQVEDAKLVNTLSKAYEEKTPKLAACNVSSVSELESRAEKIEDNTNWYDTHLASLKQAVTAVTDSRDAKTLKDAKSKLDGKLKEARNLYESSDGKVADGKTRDSLKQAIDTAAKLNDSKDAKEISEKTSALTKGIDSVNQSVKAKSEADRKAREEADRKAQEAAQAQAEAAAAAQAQTAQQQTQQYTAPQQSYTPTYTAPQQSYTAPQQSHTAPQQSTQQSAPSTGGSGGGDGFVPTSGGHGCGSECGTLPDYGVIIR